MPSRPRSYRPQTGPRPPATPRPSASARGYDRRWRTARLAHLEEHPLCALCLALGLTVEATEVDHRVPHKGDRVLFWDRSNWQSLCKPHHDRKTARTDGGFGRAPTPPAGA